MRLWRFARLTLYFVGAVAVLFLFLLSYLIVSGGIWYPRQRSRVEELRRTEAPSGMDREGDGEDRFAALPLDDATPINRLRMIATHNSYHIEPDWIRRFLIGIVEPDEPAKLRYSHEPLWEQLESGIRSFELDVRYRRNRFAITHVPLVDNRGSHPDFELTLAEIDLWSAQNPNHVPIVVLLELKRDWMFLDPFLKEWDADALAALDQSVRRSIGTDRILSPDDLTRGAPSLAESVSLLGWPTLGALRGMIIFVAHTSAATDELYIAGDPTLSGRAMFTSRPATLPDGEERPDAIFAIHNEPDGESIAGLLAQGLIVRTRADGDGLFTDAQRDAAMASGAQIISTDRPPGNSFRPERGTVEFAPGKTLAQAW